MIKANTITSLMFAVQDVETTEGLPYPVGRSVIMDTVAIEIKTTKNYRYLISLFIVNDENHRVIRSADTLEQLEEMLGYILEPTSVSGLLQEAIAVHQNAITSLVSAMISTHVL